MIQLDGATVLLQWSVGVLAGLWVTSRHREVSLGYGWLLRGVGLAFAVLSLVAAQVIGGAPVRDVGTFLVAAAAAGALVVSVVRRKAGVRGQRERIERRQEQTFERTGIERTYSGPDRDAPEFPPALDLIAPAIGLVALVAAGLHAGGPPVLAVVRTVVGAAFLGGITDAMLLGHWYLVQPGLGRGPLLELVRLTLVVWPFEVVAMVIPTGMVSVITGGIDDHYGGMLGWMWLACAVTTGVLLAVTILTLRERAYSAVMSATGLLYLAILTAFGTDLIARALLA